MTRFKKLVLPFTGLIVLLSISVMWFWYRALNSFALGGDDVPHGVVAQQRPDRAPGTSFVANELAVSSSSESSAVAVRFSALSRDEAAQDIDPSIMERYVKALEWIWSREGENFADRLMLDEARSDPDSGIYVYLALADPARASQAQEDLWRLCFQSFGQDGAESAYERLLGRGPGDPHSKGPFGGFGEHDVRIEFSSDGKGFHGVKIYTSDDEGRFMLTLWNDWTGGSHDRDDGDGGGPDDSFGERQSLRWLLGDGFDLSREGFGRLLPREE